MSLDYSKGCVNFRDVGECLNLLASRDVFPAGRLFRGGKLDFVETAEEIYCPGTIINLRKGHDPENKRFRADYWHFPISNDHEKYDTTDRTVRCWLNDLLRCLAEDVLHLPVLFHCTSGKDRTGVAVAALLTVLGVERELIVQEYLWSAGEVQRNWIEGALQGIGNPSHYFRRINFPDLRRKVIETDSAR
jgi:protein-tyrosine phosphatase